MATVTERLARVITLDSDVFGEVAADTHATGQAILVVMGVALAQGVGESLGGSAAQLFVGIADGCLRWVLWTVSILAAARVLGIRGELGALFRALGFAAAPLALGAFQFLPWLGAFFWAAKWVLGASAFVLAVGRVLAVETGQAVALCGIGLLLAMVLAVPASWLYPG
ncbi:MAG: hypothetical protein ABFS46_03390 [Myxococcota bacterium]